MYSDPSHSQHNGAEPCIWRLLWSPKQWKHLYLGQGLTKLLISYSMLTPSDGFLWCSGRKEGVSGWGGAMGLCPSPIIAQKQFRVSFIQLVYWEKLIIFIVCTEAIAYLELIPFEDIRLDPLERDVYWAWKAILIGKGIGFQSIQVCPKPPGYKSKSQMFSQQGFPREERFDFLTNDPQLNIDCFNHCLTSFYDHDSEPIIQSNCSAQQVTSPSNQVVCYLQHLYDIRDTPLSDLMISVTSNPAFQGVDLKVVRRNVVKLKNRLKRERAKNRNKQGVHDIRTPTLRVPLQSEEDEHKKRNNRLSAQLSRDRKKEKARALEQLNRELQEECKLQKMENQRLKRQAQKSHQSQLASPFTRMILFLGIFFLFTVVKDVLSSDESSKAIAKMQAKTFTLAGHDRIALPTFLSQKEALQTIEEGLVEGIGEREIAYKVLQGVRAKLNEWWTPLSMGMLLGETAHKPAWQLIDR